MDRIEPTERARPFPSSQLIKSTGTDELESKLKIVQTLQIHQVH